MSTATQPGSATATGSAVRVTHAVVGACAAACLGMLGYWAIPHLAAPSYVTAAEGIAAADLANATAALAGSGIPHRLEGPTSSVQVPATLVEEAHTALLEAGVTGGTPDVRRAPPAHAPRSYGARSLESVLARDIERLLSVEGGLTATAVVRATLDADAEMATRQEYTPSKVVAVAERATQEEAKQMTTDGEVLARYSRSQAARVNGATQTVRSWRKSSPVITRLTVAVVVHDPARASNATRRQIRRLVSAAAGLDRRRGDTVVVSFSGSR